MARRDLLSVAIRGDLRQHMKEERRLLRPAMAATLRTAGRELRDDLRQHVGAALGRKVGRRWKMRFYGRGRQLSDMAVIVYPDGAARLRSLLQAHEDGAVIRAQSGRYLAIPTQHAVKANGRGKLESPRDLQESFVQKSRNGALIVFAPVREASRLGRGGAVQSLAVANNRILGRGARRATRAALSAGIVPMFTLVKSVRIGGNQINTAARARRVGDRLPVLFVEEMERRDGRQ